MSDRPESKMRMRRVVESSKLDDTARDIAAALGREFRHRALQTQLVAEELGYRGRKAARSAAASASRTTTETVAPALRRAGRNASRTATQQVAPAIVSTASDAGSRVAPALHRASSDADDALREFADSPAGRATLIGAIAGGVASAAMGLAMVAARRAGAMSELPPQEITKKGAKKAAKAARKKAKREREEARASQARASRVRASQAADSGRDARAADRNGSIEAARSGDSDRSSSSGGSVADEVQARAAGAVEAASEAVHHVPSPVWNVAATALHVGFGMALGAGFGLAHSQLPKEWRAPLPTLGESIGFATAVWAGSYAGWVPLLGLMPPPHEDQAGRPATMIASHWLFGAILGAGLVAGLRATEE